MPNNYTISFWEHNTRKKLVQKAEQSKKKFEGRISSCENFISGMLGFGVAALAFLIIELASYSWVISTVPLAELMLFSCLTALSFTALIVTIVALIYFKIHSNKTKETIRRIKNIGEKTNEAQAIYNKQNTLNIIKSSRESYFFTFKIPSLDVFLRKMMFYLTEEEKQELIKESSESETTTINLAILKKKACKKHAG